MLYTNLKSKPELAILVYFVIFIGLFEVSRQANRINQWSRLSNTEFQPNTSASTFPSAEYKFIVLGWRMNWFEALDKCRSEGDGAELLSIESPSEQQMILQILSGVSRQIHRDEMPNDRIWHVNAHMYLYNDESWAYANGRAIDLIARRTIEPKNCSAWGVRPHVIENECFGLVYLENVSPYLIDMNCTFRSTYRAICKRPINSPQIRTTETYLLNFNKSEWMRSPKDVKLFYRIIDLQRVLPGKANWYSARLLCKKYGAALTDVEDEAEFKWLKEKIGEIHRKEKITGITAYFVDLHRFLYDTNEWSWGGLPNPNRSFVLNLPSNPFHDHCELQLCASVTHTTDLLQKYLALVPMYCGGNWRARAICKKRLPLAQSLPTKNAPYRTTRTRNTRLEITTRSTRLELTTRSNWLELTTRTTPTLGPGESEYRTSGGPALESIFKGRKPFQPPYRFVESDRTETAYNQTKRTHSLCCLFLLYERELLIIVGSLALCALAIALIAVLCVARCLFARARVYHPQPRARPPGMSIDLHSTALEFEASSTAYCPIYQSEALEEDSARQFWLNALSPSEDSQMFYMNNQQPSQNSGIFEMSVSDNRTHIQESTFDTLEDQTVQIDTLTIEMIENYVKRV